MELFEQLESKFSKFIETSGCVTVNTGTSALHIALEALQLPIGSEVIVPQYTMIATAWAVYYARLKPIFIDCDDSLLIDISQIEQNITTKTKVIMVTHVYGRVVNMDKIMSIAKKYNLRVIEDAAEAHGCDWKNKKVGSYDIGCFSFYKNKIICGEEGGAVTSNDINFLEIVRDMKSMSFGNYHNYTHDRIGFNYRMTNSQASLILNSLKCVETNILIRKENELIYNKLISNQYHMPKRNIPWVYDVKVPDNSIVDILKQKNIQARYGFKPASINSPFNLYENINKSYVFSKQIMYLPVFQTKEDTVQIAKEFNLLCAN